MRDLEREWLRITKRRDRVIGVVLGIVLGIAVVVVFVFFASEQTIDAPSVDHDDAPPVERPAEPQGRR